MRLMSLTAQVMAPIPLWDLPTIPSCQARPQSPCLKATQRSAPSPKTVCCVSTHKPISLKALLTVAGQAYRATVGSRDIQAYQALLVIQALVSQVIQGQVFLGFRGFLDSLGSVAFQASRDSQGFQDFLGLAAFLDFQESRDFLALPAFQASRDIAVTIQDQVAFLAYQDSAASQGFQVLVVFLVTQVLAALVGFRVFQVTQDQVFLAFQARASVGFLELQDSLDFLESLGLAALQAFQESAAFLVSQDSQE